MRLNSSIPQRLYHYTNHDGYLAIPRSGFLMPSISGRGNDARYGSGQYLTDISPEMIPCIRVRDMTPFQRQNVNDYYSLLRLKKIIMGTVSIGYVRYFIEFDVSGLTTIIQCQEHIYLNQSQLDLDIQPLMIRWGATVG